MGLARRAAVVLALATCPSAVAVAQEGPAGWEAASPEGAGLDSGRLAEALRRVREEEPHTQGVVLIADGRVILDAAFWPCDATEPHNLASATKSVTTTLIAIADAEGALDLDQPMPDVFAGRAERIPRPGGAFS